MIQIKTTLKIFLVAFFGLTLFACGGSETSSVGTGSGKTTLSWEAPKTNADGTSLKDLAGFRLYYGTTSPISKTNSQGITVGNTTTYNLSGLDPGVFYFAVTASDLSGNESNLSGEVSKEIPTL